MFQCIFIYYKNQQCQAIMRQLLVQVVLYNFQLIEQTPIQELSNIVDVLESFFNFTAMIAKKIPQGLAEQEIDNEKLMAYGKKHLMVVLVRNLFMQM